MPDYHLAQLNIARMRAPLDTQEMSEFREFIAPINALAERQDGFVWRLTDEAGVGATGVETPFPDDMVIVNMSVWRDVGTLRHFVYDTAHSYFVKSRRKWFERMRTPYHVLWWVEAGHVPTLTEAAERLERLAGGEASAEAFTFAEVFAAPTQ